MSESKTIKIETELVEKIDEWIAERGGTYSDWIVLSVIHGFWKWGAYSDSFRLFLMTEFDTQEVQQEAEKLILAELKKLES